MSKKIISLCLAAMLSVSMVAVTAVSVSADTDENGRYVPSADTDTYRYYFYMPENWYNEFTETAGVYWWEGTDACPSWQDMYTAQPADDAENVYYIDCPTDAVKIIFNNHVDGGEDAEDPKYTKAAQTTDITAAPQEDGGESWAYFPGMDGFDPDSELYPDGLANFDNMIYVIDPDKIDINVLNQKQTCKGEWYYYYGNGEYGYEPVKGDGAVYSSEYLSIDQAIADKENGVVPETTEPTTEEPTEAPTTDVVTTDPATPDVPASPDEPEVAPLTVNATSNFFPTAQESYNEETNEVTVTYYLGLGQNMVNTEWYLSYDPEVLSVNPQKNVNAEGNGFGFMPQVSSGAVYNIQNKGEIAANASNLATYKITADKPFVTATFDVIGEGETTVDLQVRVLSIGEIDPMTFSVDQDTIKYYVSEYTSQEVEGVAEPTLDTVLTPSTFVPATTVVPETTTVAPETTTVAPETTTVAPETTTVAPETTTVAPETTTVAPETTTVASDTTTSTDATSGTGSTVASGSTSSTPDQPSNGTSNDNGAVKTGDASLAVVILTILVAATSVMFVLRKREMF